MEIAPPLAVILVVSLLVIAFLSWLICGFEGVASDRDWGFLPGLNALFNSVSASAVALGLWSSVTERKRAHGIAMATALAASALFLIGYILNHSLHGDTRFLTDGWLRPLYFSILNFHVLLSILALPMALTTVYLAIVHDWPKPRRLARWTNPVWLYVSTTGVLVFVFLRLLNTPA